MIMFQELVRRHSFSGAYNNNGTIIGVTVASDVQETTQPAVKYRSIISFVKSRIAVLFNNIIFC